MIAAKVARKSQKMGIWAILLHLIISASGSDLGEFYKTFHFGALEDKKMRHKKVSALLCLICCWSTLFDYVQSYFRFSAPVLVAWLIRDSPDACLLLGFTKAGL